MTRDDIIDMFELRHHQWLVMSVEIAGLFPHAWYALKRRAKVQLAVDDIKLKNISIDANRQVLEYIVVGGNYEIRAKFPMEMLLEAESNTTGTIDTPDVDIIEEWETYLEHISPIVSVMFTGTVEEVAHKRVLEQMLRAQQDEHPTMFIDYQRLIDVEMLLKQNRLIKGAYNEKVH